MEGNFGTNNNNNNVAAPQPPLSMSRQPSFSQGYSSSDDEDYNDDDDYNYSSDSSSSCSDKDRSPDVNLPPTKLAKLDTDTSSEFDAFVRDATKKIRTCKRKQTNKQLNFISHITTPALSPSFTFRP